MYNAFGTGEETWTPNAIAPGPKPGPYTNSGTPAYTSLRLANRTSVDYWKFCSSKYASYVSSSPRKGISLTLAQVHGDLMWSDIIANNE